MAIIATDTDQIVLCVRMKMQSYIRSKDNIGISFWAGCIEVERKEYTAKDILHLADKPEDIVKVWRICMTSGQCEDITDLVLEAADE